MNKKQPIQIKYKKVKIDYKIELKHKKVTSFSNNRGDFRMFTTDSIELMLICTPTSHDQRSLFVTLYDNSNGQNFKKPVFLNKKKESEILNVKIGDENFNFKVLKYP